MGKPRAFAQFIVPYLYCTLSGYLTLTLILSLNVEAGKYRVINDKPVVHPGGLCRRLCASGIDGCTYTLGDDDMLLLHPDLLIGK